MNLSAEVKANILKAQVNELTEYYVYSNIAKTLPDDANRKVMM
jgi:hypothetical protein